MATRLLGLLVIVLIAASILAPLTSIISEALSSGVSNAKLSSVEVLQQEATTNTTITTTIIASTTSTSREYDGTNALKAKVIVYIHLLRHMLLTLGLQPNASAEEIASAMSIDIELANKIAKYASMDTGTVLNITSEQLIVVYKDVEETYDRMVEILKERIKLQEKKKIKERITAKLALRIMLHLEVLARTWNDTRLLNLTLQLREALRTKNIEFAKNLTLVISDYLEAHYAEEMVEEVSENLADLLEELSEIPANLTMPREVIEKLKKQHEHVEELVKLIRKKIRVSVLDPATLAKLFAASDSAEDLCRMVSQLLNETVKGNATTPRVVIVASEWAERLKTRIDVLASILLNITDKEVKEELIELISEANSTLSLAEAMIEAGDYGSAMRLLGKTQSYVVKAESLVRLYQLKEVMKKNFSKAREHVREVSLEDIIKTIEKRHPEIINITLDILTEKVQKLISQAESMLLEVANKTANMTEVPEPIKRLIEKAQEHLEEAREHLAEAIEAVNSSEYFEAREHLLEAMGHALRAYHYAAQASKLLELGIPEELAEKLRGAISDIGRKIVKEKMKHTAANLIHKVEELINETTKKLAFIESVIESENISLPRGFIEAFNISKEKLAKASEILASAKQALEEGDVDMALRLLVKAKAYAEQAYHIADELEDALKELLEERSSSNEEESQDHSHGESRGASSGQGAGGLGGVGAGK